MKELIIIDLEGTCTDDRQDGSLPDAERETIEIGAVLIDVGSGDVLSEFNSLVHPVRHPVLSGFCIALTGITQADVDGAKPFPEVWMRFLSWLELRDEFCSWGKYDLDQFKRDCGFHGLSLHFRRHCDLSKAYRQKRCGKGRAMKQLGIIPTGKKHRGLDDARNISKIAVAMLKVGKEIRMNDAQ